MQDYAPMVILWYATQPESGFRKSGSSAEICNSSLNKIEEQLDKILS